MMRLRKGKKIIKEYKSIIALLNDFETLCLITGGDEEHIENIKRALRFNMFGMCINGAKMRLGNGYILETLKDEQ